MKSVREIIALSCDYLRTKNAFRAKREVEELIAFSLGSKRLDLYLHFDKPLVEEELAAIRKNLTRMAAGEPLQYIEGRVDFYGCKIAVDKRVLIPRPETEGLVDYLSKWFSRHDHAGKVLADVCTGSGCIGIALKKAHAALIVEASDLSPDALLLAQKNAADNQVDINFFNGDLLSPFSDSSLDFLVCNPPYVSEKEFAHLEPHVRDFEPKQALVSGPTGYEYYERLASELPRVMRPGGWVWLELGASQAAAMKAIFHKFNSQKFVKDLNGIDRILEFSIA